MWGSSQDHHCFLNLRGKGPEGGAEGGKGKVAGWKKAFYVLLCVHLQIKVDHIY